MALVLEIRPHSTSAAATHCPPAAAFHHQTCGGALPVSPAICGTACQSRGLGCSPRPHSVWGCHAPPVFSTARRSLVTKHVQPQHAAAPVFWSCTWGFGSMPQHAAASNFLSSCVCLPAPALLAWELPHVSPVCFYLSCHESVICTNNIQSTVNTKHTTFPIRWENSAGEWERQPGTHARKAALQPPPICVEAPPQPNPTIIVNVPRPEPAEPECSQKRRFPYVE